LGVVGVLAASVSFGACGGSEAEPPVYGTAAKGGGGGTGGGGATGGTGATGTGGASGGMILPDVGPSDQGMNTETACAKVQAQAEAVPLDIFFQLDTSGSMSGGNISALTTGISNFIVDPKSQGIGASGQHFPIGGFNETCNAAEYQKLAVPWAPLPYPQFASWVKGLQADGYTPSIPALTGAVNACKERIAAEKSHTCAVIFVTDGQPEGNCPPTGQAAQQPLGNIAAQANQAGIKVFAIGFPGLSALGQSVLNTIAQSGGTQKPYIIQGGNVAQQFLDALNAIRGSALGCEYKVPPVDGGKLNPDMVEVDYTPGGGEAGTQAHEIPRCETQAKCGQSGCGWYYDNNTSPTKITMCPQQCDILQKDAKGKIEIFIACSPKPPI
jgi:uncharacterized protein YegL